MDYAPVALQATDVLVDKHFHKIPDKAFRKETYKPRVPFKNSRRRRREEEARRNSRDQGEYQDERRNSKDSRNQEDRSSGVPRQEEPYRDPEIEEAGYDSEPDYTSRQRERNRRERDWDSRERERDFRDIPRHSGAGIGGGIGYGYGNSYEESHHSNDAAPHPIYSQQPPHLRPEYLPKYVAPSQLASDNQYPLCKRDTQRRARPLHSTQLQTAHRTKESHMENIKDRADRYGLKSEAKGLFTDSSKGLAGGAIGALLGGWAAEKLQEAQTGRDRKDLGDRGKIYTLIGAAAGGLVVNAVVERWEDGKGEGKGRGEKGERERERDGRSECGRRDSVRSRRDRDDSW
ncbi:predicted protein [Sclerotinia sclerotiorum 1980 UF-70]|uniref:Glycine zipper 2TM domain-containing protein n=1 Tax=Sclerotinia sclerotiorum (strain ATCC 18683 / 1980 / Ss-1) TaxID=665079 RepID=A7EA55_SCLS1|nr:predicted protein [Sclerotinia sclerotiorum 1980 UF-70]EDN99333.1 predicted protein [Sclerotinia sclerotiorum 1980 UF-70]